MKITLRLIFFILLSVTIAGYAKTNSGNFAAPFQQLRPTVGGAVFGLIGTLVLQNNDATLRLESNGAFFFQNTDAPGTYNVTVFKQPVAQTCTVSNGSGKIIRGNVTNIMVHCLPNHS